MRKSPINSAIDVEYKTNNTLFGFPVVQDDTSIKPIDIKFGLPLADQHRLVIKPMGDRWFLPSYQIYGTLSSSRSEFSVASFSFKANVMIDDTDYSWRARLMRWLYWWWLWTYPTVFRSRVGEYRSRVLRWCHVYGTKLLVGRWRDEKER